MKKNFAGNLARIGLAAFTAALLLGSCKKKEENREPAPGEKFKLRAVTQTTFSEFIIADRLGFFADEGIEIEYVGALGQGVSQNQAVVQGYIDVFTQGHPSSVGQARLGGLEITQVVPGFVDHPDNPHIMYLVRDDSPYKTLEDIGRYGAKIASGTGFSPCTNGYLYYHLTKHGYDPEKAIEWVTFSQGGGTAELAMSKGDIDVTTSHTPYGGIGLTMEGVRLLGTTWDIFQSPGAGLAARGFSDKFIEEHPDIVQGFANAMYRARVFVNNNNEYARKVAGEYLGLDPNEISSNSYDQNKNIDPKYIEEWWEISESIGLWEPGAIRPEDVYTNAFVPKDIPASDYLIGR
jgi:ABC-type nitrate/sulfonate/bicarbonate transport system substrate-binding protein